MAHASVVLREASPADIADILRLYEVAGITSASAYTVAEATQKFADLSRYPFYRVFVATLADVAVGTYELLLMDNLAKRGAKTAIVEDVAVDPKVQGQGIGKQMMLHARAVAKRHGAYKLMLSSNDKRTEAHAFYDALGFRRHGVSFLVDIEQTSAVQP